MDDLKKSIEIRRYYNSMPIEEFRQKLETYLDIKICEKDFKEFKYIGLINTDLFTICIEKGFDGKIFEKIK